MKRHAFFIPVLLTIVVALSSCTGSDVDDYTYSSNCYIKSMTLGQMRRTVTTKTQAGNDTTYTVGVTGSYYPLQIDQRRQTITSATPLPMNTRISNILVTVEFDGALVYAPAADTTSWTAYSSSDSIDFSSPVLFRVYAADGSGYRDYTASLTVLNFDPDAYSWTAMTDAPMLDERQRTKLAVLGNDMMAMSIDNAGNAFMATKAADDTWSEQPCTGIVNADPRTLQTFANQLWVSTTDGQLMQSDNGIVWTPATSQPATHTQLIAASETTIYVATTDGIAPEFNAVYASNDGTTWTQTDIEDNAFSLFPTQQLSSVAYIQSNGHDRVLVAGQTTDATQTTVWNLREKSSEPWVLFSQTGDSNYTLRAEETTSIVAYNQMLIAIGTTSTISYDNGITWHSAEALDIPSELTQATETIAATTYNNEIWVTAGSKVWKAVLNSMKN